MRFACETAEGSRLDDAFAVALEGRAVWVWRGKVIAQEERVVGVGDG